MAQVIDFNNKKAQGSDGVVHAHVNDFSYRAKMNITTPKCWGVTEAYNDHAYQMREEILHINLAVLQQVKD